MYKILGADGKESGPISAGEVRQGVADGRFNLATLVRTENESEWKTLGTLPEFADLFATAGESTSPSPATTKTCWLATASLICGVFGALTCVGGPVGLVLGFMAYRRIQASKGRLTGWGLAAVGVVVSLISTFLFFGKYNEFYQPYMPIRIHCVNNLRQLGMAVRIYSTNNHGLFPPAETWCAAIQKEVGSTNVFQCGANPDLPCGYAFNARLAGKKANEVNPQTVMIFESDAGWNASGGPELMLKSPRHKRRLFALVNTDLNTGVFVVGFADGSVELLREAQLQRLRWGP
jgi:hypothetical protein